MVASSSKTAARFSALNHDAAKKNIEKIRGDGAALRELIHTTAVGILMHAREHNDPRMLQDLRFAISATLGKNMESAFKDWVAKFSALRWNENLTVMGKKVGGFEYDRNAPKELWVLTLEDAQDRAKSAGGAVEGVNLVYAEKMPMWELERNAGDPSKPPFDLLKYLVAGLQRANKEMGASNVVRHKELVKVLNDIKLPEEAIMRDQKSGTEYTLSTLAEAVEKNYRGEESPSETAKQGLDTNTGPNAGPSLDAVNRHAAGPQSAPNSVSLLSEATVAGVVQGQRGQREEDHNGPGVGGEGVPHPAPRAQAKSTRKGGVNAKGRNNG